jgi:hypothetical protein
MDLKEAQNRVNKMYRNAPTAASDVEENILQLEDRKEELELDAEAVDNAIMNVNKADMVAFIQGKEMSFTKGFPWGGVWKDSISFAAGQSTAVSNIVDPTDVTHWVALVPNQGFYPPDTVGTWLQFAYAPIDYRNVIGGDFGVSTLRSWEIQQLQDLPNPTPPPINIPTWVTVYSPTVNWDSDEQATGFMDDFDWGYDLLYKELDSGGTYGIYPNIDLMGDAIDLLTENLGKILESVDVFKKYIPF